MTKYYLLRFWDPDWVHMYPRRNGEMPTSYTLNEAKKQQQEFLSLFHLETKIVSEFEALNYEVPKRY